MDLAVYDLMGREVKRLVVGQQDAGEHLVVWNCQGRDDKPVPRGVYFLRLDTPGFRAVKKAVVTR